MEEERGLIMKLLLIVFMSLMLTGCGKAMTRLLPKIEKIDLPEELMVPPKELKIIEKPAAPQAELTRDVLTEKPK
jgi:hypothetical protein